jgi:hypothetical protein
MKFEKPSIKFEILLTKKEAEALHSLSMSQEMSINGIMRQALALYQLVCIRSAEGETFSFSGDRARALLFFGPEKHES